MHISLISRQTTDFFAKCQVTKLKGRKDPFDFLTFKSYIREICKVTQSRLMIDHCLPENVNILIKLLCLCRDYPPDE